jgi:hypothetical protein
LGAFTFSQAGLPTIGCASPTVEETG